MTNSLKFGLIFAGASILWSLFEILLANYFGFFELSTITSLLAFFIPLLVLLFAFREEKKLHEIFRTSDIMRTGAIISLVGSFGYSIYLFILYTIYPQVIQPYLTYVQEQLERSGTSPEEITAAINQIQSQFSAINQAAFSFILTLAIGLILSWVLAKFMKTKFNHTEISATPE